MKTSVIAVHDMLSVLSVIGVEKRIGEVPGVKSVTVNFAAGNATVRYDETRLDIANIKSAVRQNSHQSAALAAPSSGGDPEGHTTPGAPPAAPAPAASKITSVAPAPADAAEPINAAPSTTVPGAPKTASEARKGATQSGHEGHESHKAAGATSAMSADMAHEMGHDGMDLAAMVRDMRNRFWICLIFTIPIFIYAPMGGMFEPPAPPFGLELNPWLFFFASAAVLYPSWPFFVSAWRALRKGVLGMAALIVLSVGTAGITGLGFLISLGVARLLVLRNSGAVPGAEYVGTPPIRSLPTR